MKTSWLRSQSWMPHMWYGLKIRKISHCLITGKQIKQEIKRWPNQMSQRNLRSESNQIDYLEIVERLKKNAKKWHKHTRTYMQSNGSWTIFDLNSGFTSFDWCDVSIFLILVCKFFRWTFFFQKYDETVILPL